MINVLEKIQSDFLVLSPGLLVPLGILFAIGGICIWLGGMRWNWITGMLMAGVTAAIVTCFTPVTIQVQVIAVVIAASIGLVLNKPVMIFTCGIMLTVLVVWVVTAAANVQSSAEWNGLLDTVYEEPIGFEQSAAILCNWLKYIVLNAASMFRANTLIVKSIALAIGVAAVFFGIIFQRLFSAAACSIFGVGMVFFGMIMLLLYKGSEPLTVIYNRPTLYVAIAGCLIIFGIFAEIMLCSVKKSAKNDKSNKKNDGERK